MLASGGGEGAAPAEVASLMRAAGLPPDGRYLVAAMNAEADRVTGPNADRWRCDLAAELAVPVAEGALVAPLGDEIILLVPSLVDHAPAGVSPGAAPGIHTGAAPDDTASATHLFASAIRRAQPAVESDRSRIRLTVGLAD